MRSSKEQSARRETLNIRIQPELRAVIDHAARQAAEDALMDRAIIAAGPKAYAEFLARLDAPPQPNDRLRRTIKSKAPWE